MPPGATRRDQRTAVGVRPLRCDRPPHPRRGAAAAGSGDAPTEPGKPAKARARRFKAAHVFDVSQTDRDPLPDAGPALLTGQAPAGLWDALAAQVTAHGYTIERGPCGGANGYTDPAAMVVRVRDAVDEAQAVKTLAHDPLTALPARDRGDLSGWCGCAAPVVVVLVLSWGSAARVGDT